MKNRYATKKRLRRYILNLRFPFQKKHRSGLVRAILNIECVCGIALLALLYFPPLLGFQEVVVASGSMQPALKEGSLAFIEPALHCLSGDIVAFKQGNQIVCHRVVSIADDGRIVTQGDANAKADIQSIKQDDILGIVWWSLPYAGALLFALESKKMLAVACVAFIQVGLFVFEKVFPSNRKVKCDRGLSCA